MHIIVQCPHCKYRWWLEAMAADRRIRCRKCSTLIKVPNLTEVPAAADIISQAKSHVFVDDSGKTYG
jgi:DNA-directed RNA polymerase subunit RPC12/RpoP